MSDVYYFGCWCGSGHFLWTPDAMTRSEGVTPWTVLELDGSLAGDPALEDPRRRGHWSSENQPEGIVRIHRRAGWTAIAFWDRSVDRRAGSNSVFIASGEMTGEEMLVLFEQSFQAAWARIVARFPLVLPPGADR